MTARRAFALLFLLPFAAVHGGTATPPAATLAGTVTDEEGRPLADAEVRLELTAGEGLRWTRTDARGRFRFDGLCAGCDYAVRAAHPGFAPEVLTLDTPRQGGGTPALRLALRRGRTAFGVVVDEAGRPAAGIVVEMVRELPSVPYGSFCGETGYWGVCGEIGPYRAVTGPEGRFEIPDLPAGEAMLGIARPGRPLSQVRRLDISDAPGRTDLGRLEIADGRTIAGRALDPQGKPLAGVEVWVVPPRDPLSLATWNRDLEAGPQAVTGPEGRFEISHVSTRANLTLCRTGYEPGTLSFSGDVTLAPPIRQPRPRISGRVVTSTGEPVAGAVILNREFLSPGQEIQDLSLDELKVVGLSPCPTEEAPKPPPAVSGPDGRFVLEVGPPIRVKEGSGIWNLWTQPSGFLEARQEVEYRPGKEPFVELVVDRGAVVTGRIFTAQGKPAAGVGIYIEGEVRAVTGADGAFRLEGVEPGRRSLTASHRELGQAARRIDVAAGGTRQDLTLDGRGDRKIRGRILGPDGGPLPGVRVFSTCPECGEADWSAGDGSFTLLLDRQRRIREIYAERAGFVPGRVSLPPGDEPVDGLEIELTSVPSPPSR